MGLGGKKKKKAWLFHISIHWPNQLCPAWVKVCHLPHAPCCKEALLPRHVLPSSLPSVVSEVGTCDESLDNGLLL